MINIVKTQQIDENMQRSFYKKGNELIIHEIFEGEDYYYSLNVNEVKPFDIFDKDLIVDVYNTAISDDESEEVEYGLDIIVIQTVTEDEYTGEITNIRFDDLEEFDGELVDYDEITMTHYEGGDSNGVVDEGVDLVKELAKLQEEMAKERKKTEASILEILDLMMGMTAE